MRIGLESKMRTWKRRDSGMGDRASKRGRSSPVDGGTGKQVLWWNLETNDDRFVHWAIG